MGLPAVEAPADAPIVVAWMRRLRRADPEGEPAPMMITPGTDAKALAMLGIPTYGFAPLRLDPEMPFLSLFHGHDERVPVSAHRVRSARPLRGGAGIRERRPELIVARPRAEAGACSAILHATSHARIQV